MIASIRRLVRGETRVDFIGRSRLLALITVVVIAGSLVAMFKPGLDFSLEFTGGTLLRVTTASDVDVSVAEVEAALDEFALTDQVIQIARAGSDSTIEVRSQRVDPDELEQVRVALAELAGQTDEDGRPALGLVDVSDVGPSWGQQVSNKAIRALVVFLILVALYISIRFEPKMAIASLVALVHDLIAAAGIYALTGLSVSPATLIAILTLMGISLYDTIVVFDRVKENAGQIGVRETYGGMVNRSLNEVLMRAVNTSITTLLPVGAMLFVGVGLFGADTLQDLATAMFIGSIVGMYSSIFLAAPVLAFLKEREPRYRSLKEKARTAPKVMEPAPATAAAPTETKKPAPSQPRTSTGRPIKPRRTKRRR